jgi:23S rRNA G2069 N7-methylase RlmK/C1962 C5-methylase RlmI
MFWFDRFDPSTVFCDNRVEQCTLKDSSSSGGSRVLNVRPDVRSDFRQLPFRDSSFRLVVFDPPHFSRNGSKGWMAKKYGVLSTHWKHDFRTAFEECFRVLKLGGTLVFKWNENEISSSEVLSCCPTAPLFGQRGGKNMQTHWLVFFKQEPPEEWIR